MLNSYSVLFLFVTCLNSFSLTSHAQTVFSDGQIEFNDGTIKAGELAYRQDKSGGKILFRTDHQLYYTGFEAKDVRSFQIASNRYVSRRLDDDPNSIVVFMHQLVAGSVGLLLYERSDSRNIFLLEQQGKLIPINNKYPVTTLSQLPSCPGIKLPASNSGFLANSKALTRYMVAYNRCVKPDFPTQFYSTSPRFLKVSIGPRVFLPMSYYRIKFDNGLLYPASSPSSKPGFGLAINFSARGRLGAGLDLALLSRKGRWITDSTAVVVKLVEQSLYINPFLRYEFRSFRRQVITPYLVLGIVFNKILNGQVTVNPVYNYKGSPQPVVINKEAGIDEFGGSLGGGVQWQLTPGLALVADARFVYTVAALSTFEVPPADGFPGPGPRFTPRSYLLNCSFGLNFCL